MTGDDLAQLLERLRRTIWHLEIGVVVFLVGAGIQLGDDNPHEHEEEADQPDWDAIGNELRQPRRWLRPGSARINIKNRGVERCGE